jgi:hypothetical protein
MARKKKERSYVERGDPKNREDGELRKLKNDPHNPKNLLRKRRDNKGDGYNQDGSNWKPTAWNDSGAGKGDSSRPIDIPNEVYGYRYDLATGRITRKEFDKLMGEYTSNEMGE